ncbi:MAG: MFS transporter, partial [Candidatus Hodarchaeota archaeon]
RFHLSLSRATILFSVLASFYILGSLLSGKLVNKFGRKPLTIVGYLFLGLLIILFTNIPRLWASVIIALFCLIFVGIGDSASNSLTLEQIPRFRGTMMSTYSAATSLGAVLGAGIGGMILLWSNYQILGIVFGGLGVASAANYYLFAMDPTRPDDIAAKH